LQLTGKEKRLGELAKTTLFGEGRLDFELLGCFAETPPLAHAVISDEPSILLFENADSFAVARDVLLNLPDPPYGLIGFGGGNGIAKSLPYLRMIDRRIHRIEYVGDLDYFGLEIAARAARAAATAGLPNVQPATRLHQAMIESAQKFGSIGGWPDESRLRPTDEKIAAAAEFVAAEIRPVVLPILRNHHRIPEEVLGPAQLTEAWQPSRLSHP
jgi:hypothetical protein